MSDNLPRLSPTKLETLFYNVRQTNEFSNFQARVDSRDSAREISIFDFREADSFH